MIEYAIEANSNFTDVTFLITVCSFTRGNEINSWAILRKVYDRLRDANIEWQTLFEARFKFEVFHSLCLSRISLIFSFFIALLQLQGKCVQPDFLATDESSWDWH